MNFNYTKKGHTFQYYAEGQDIKEHNILTDKASALLSNIKDSISKKHMSGDSHLKNQMISAMGCIDKLRSCLLYSKRISKYTNDILNSFPQNESSMFLILNDSILADYESFIFHSRAMLDRLTFFVCKQIFNQSCDRFPKFKNCILNSKKDNKTQDIINILDECTPNFIGILIDNNNQRSLRSLLIHKSTIIENTQCVFTIHYQASDKIFVFDYNILNYPLFGSTWNITKYLVFTVLRILSICFEIKNDIIADQCEPLWNNIFIDYNEFLTNDNDAFDLSVGKMNPSGVEIKTIKIDKSFLELNLKNNIII